MMTFDEMRLVRRLKQLSANDCTVFALSAASRQIQNYELYGKRVDLGIGLPLKTIAETLWDSVLEGSPSESQCENFLTEMMAFAPEENQDQYVWVALGDDAITSLCYVVRHVLNGDPQEAAWAARCAYEAADQAAIRMLDIDLTPAAEKQLLAHPAVQRELDRQERDISLLESRSGTDALLELKRLSSQEHFFDQSEIVSLG